MRDHALDQAAAAIALQTRVESVFAQIAATRMAGLPICHPGLKVEALDFRTHAGDWLGALLTPWSLSLMILPGAGGRFRPLGCDEVQTWRFPAGDYDFIGNHEPALGEYQLCSLHSPMFEFGDQAEARHLARLALAALFDAGLVDSAEKLDRPPRDTSSIAPGPDLPSPVDGSHTAPPAPARRRFLRAFMPSCRP